MNGFAKWAWLTLLITLFIGYWVVAFYAGVVIVCLITRWIKSKCQKC